MRLSHRRPSRRPGFTLVELLIAVALAITLGAISVAVVNTLEGSGSSGAVVASADKASGWLITSKSKAVRDGRARGIRLIQDTTAPSPNRIFREFEYVELPEPFVPNPDADPALGRIVLSHVVDANPANSVPTAAPPKGTNTVVDRRVFYLAPDYDRFDTTVFAGDYLNLPEFGPSPFRIRSITPTPAGLDHDNDGGASTPARDARLLDLETVPDFRGGLPNAAWTGTAANPAPAAHVSFGFSFQGQPQPLVGEPPLTLGGDRAIDGTLTPAPAPGSFFPDGTPPVILFSPGGQVINQTKNPIVLWVRSVPTDGSAVYWDGSANFFTKSGENTLVVIYPRTGAVSTKSVNPDPANPFLYIRDAINAGF